MNKIGAMEEESKDRNKILGKLGAWRHPSVVFFSLSIYLFLCYFSSSAPLAADRLCKVFHTRETTLLDG